LCRARFALFIKPDLGRRHPVANVHGDALGAARCVTQGSEAERALRCSHDAEAHENQKGGEHRHRAIPSIAIICALDVASEIHGDESDGGAGGLELGGVLPIVTG
jgi:hypothetical protein